LLGRKYVMGSSTEDIDYQSLVFAYSRSADQDAGIPARHRVVVVGAGPVGLATAIDLAQQGISVLLLDDDNRLSTGSRAICFAKRTLEIFDRLGCGQRMVDKGVTWNLGKVFFHDEAVYSFNLLPEEGHGRPAFINLQQYYVEGYLLDRAQQLPNIDIRWKNKVISLEQTVAGIELGVETPEGSYTLHCDWLVAADGARSAVRGLLGLTSEGQTFRDRFLIADVRMEADFPPNAGSGSTRHFIRTNQYCCTSSRIGCRELIFNWDGTPIQWPNVSRIALSQGSKLSSERTRVSNWNGSASIPSPAYAWKNSNTVACCSQVIVPMECRPSVLEAQTVAYRMQTIWPGSSAWCGKVWLRTC
jgi:FAD binding domain